MTDLRGLSMRAALFFVQRSGSERNVFPDFEKTDDADGISLIKIMIYRKNRKWMSLLSLNMEAVLRISRNM